MDVKIVVDKQSELRMNEAAQKLREYCNENNIKAYNQDVLVVFSNDHNFVRDFVIKLPRRAVVINVTENLSEQHVINTLKYVADICYLKTDVNIIATRIIRAYTKNKVRMKQRI